MIHMHFGCKDVVGRTTTYSDDSVRTLLIQAVTPDWRTSKPAFALEEGTIEQWIDYFEATDLCRPDPPGETCQMERNSLEMSESQGHRLHREGTGAELLQEGRSLLVRLRRDGTAIYLSPRVTSATVAKYLQPSPIISNHRQISPNIANGTPTWLFLTTIPLSKLIRNLTRSSSSEPHVDNMRFARTLSS